MTLANGQQRPTRAAEKSGRWRVVAGSAIALAVSNGPILLFTFSVFLKPISEQYGWPRGEMSLGVTLALILGGLATPLVGALIDRWSVQRVTLSCITLFSASFALISLTPASISAFITLYALAGLFASGHAPLPYAKAISGWFDERRGLGLGVAMAGVGVGIAVMPQLAQAFLDAAGWRSAYALLGAATWIIAFPAVLFLVKDPVVSPAVAGLPADQSHQDEDIGSVLLGREFWLIMVASFLVVAAINGVIAHLVALLMDNGVPAGAATAAIATVGLATIASRLVSGYLLDRIFAPYLAAVIFLMPLPGIAILLARMTSLTAINVAAICIGVGLGAEVDIIGFLVGRYFGLRRYGQIYGYLFAAFTIGSGVGPFVMGLSFDETGGYAPSLLVFGGGLVVSSVLIARLGRYRFA